MKKVLLSFALLLLVLCGIAFGLLYTSSGLHFFLKIAPGNVNYTEVSGNLAESLHIKDLHYKYKKIKIDIGEATLTWHPWKLFSHAIQIDTLQAKSIQITLPDPQDKSLTQTNQKKGEYHLTLPNMPTDLGWATSIEHLQLNKLSIKQGSQNFQLDKARASLLAKGNKIQINTLTADSSYGKINASGTVYLNALLNSEFALDATLQTPKETKLTLIIKHQALHFTSTGPIAGTAELNWSDQVAGKWSLQSSDLTSLYPNSQGEMITHGLISGDKSNPTIQASLQANKLLIHGVKINGQANINGTPEQHSITLSSSFNDHSKITSTLIGKLTPSSWNASMTELSFTDPSITPLSLVKPAHLHISNDDYQAEKICLSSTTGNGCTSFHYNKAGLAINADLHHLSLALLDTFLPETMSSTGDITGDLQLNYSERNNRWDSKLTLASSNGQVHYLREGESHDFSFEPSTLKGELDKSGFKVSANAKLTNKSTLNFSLHSNYAGLGIPNLDNTLAGELSANATDFSLLELLAENLSNTKGVLSLHTSIGGSIGKPTFNGELAVKDAEAYVIPLGITFSNIHLTLSANNSSAFNLTGAISNHNETLHLKGKGDFAALDHPMELNVTGKNVTVFDTAEYLISASPNMTASLQGNEINLTGAIEFPKIILTPRDFSSTVSLPNDVLITGENKKPQTNSSSTHTNMDLLLSSNHINITYRGLDALISGKLQLKKTLKTQLSSQGQLTIEKGSYKAYGQNLMIKPGGTLTFTNIISNPALNLTASKQIQTNGNTDSASAYQQNLTVGIDATGTLEQPTITLFSDPAGYNQQDILSYLVFGFSQDQLNNSQSAVIWQAVNALNTGHGSVGELKDDLQEQLGLSTLGLASTTEYNPETQTEEAGTSLVIGKQINNRLSVSYSMGLVVPVNVLYVRYQLSKRWALQSDSSTYGNGGDLLYSLSID
jgi:autotransporter translocation and assembly factor TamB